MSELGRERPPADGLRRFLQPRPPAPEGETCDLCRQPIPESHRHLVRTDTRRLLCACRACALLFASDQAARHRLVPERYEDLGPAVVDGPLWESLQVPVGVAFFFVNSSIGRVAGFYPGAAGAAESLLPLDTWTEIAERSPSVRAMSEDVEALLVRRLRDGSFESFRVPIDACYELVGRIKRSWKGFDGGEEGRGEIEAFFETVRRRCAGAGGNP